MAAVEQIAMLGIVGPPTQQVAFVIKTSNRNWSRTSWSEGIPRRNLQQQQRTISRGCRCHAGGELDKIVDGLRSLRWGWDRSNTRQLKGMEDLHTSANFGRIAYPVSLPAARRDAAVCRTSVSLFIPSPSVLFWVV